MYRDDGQHLPFRDRAFDIVFSSNALEHIAHLQEFELEIKRVLKPKGIVIHIVPTSAWRFWTLVTYHLYILQHLIEYVLASIRKSQITKTHYEAARKKVSWWRILCPAAHGERGGALSELYLFSNKAWQDYFKMYGWIVSQHKKLGLFYTGNQIFNVSLSMKIRKSLANYLGSATMFYTLNQDCGAENEREK